ncbi:MAG: hypothetical protein MJE77_31450 [Proteobacteria bacterium]|nr:hypothetical protein [Pseudomonadota bacterium]
MSIKDDVQEQLKRNFQELKQLGDDIRAKLHQAGQEAMKDAMDEWQRLEPRLEELEAKVERGGKELASVTGQLFEELGRALRDLGTKMTGKR